MGSGAAGQASGNHGMFYFGVIEVTKLSSFYRSVGH